MPSASSITAAQPLAPEGAHILAMHRVVERLFKASDAGAVARACDAYLHEMFGDGSVSWRPADRGPDSEADLDAGQPVAPQSLGRMVQALDALSGEPDLSPATKDEIGSLALAFRRMLLALKKAYIGIRTDALTGLSNRVRLDEALQNEMHRTQRYGNTFSIIILDIDHFKRVNDTHGHLAGDAVLKKIAGVLAANLRQTDTAGRWGGEEFLILLPHQGRPTARALAEKLRTAIESTAFPGIGRITSSFGVAAYAAQDSVESLVKRADAALYAAKRAGRNRVAEG